MWIAERGFCIKRLKKVWPFIATDYAPCLPLAVPGLLTLYWSLRVFSRQLSPFLWLARRSNTWSRPYRTCARMAGSNVRLKGCTLGEATYAVPRKCP